MGKFSVRTEETHDLMLFRVMEERGIKTKNAAICWLIENYPKYEEMAAQVASLQWANSASNTRLGNIQKAILDKTAAEKKLLELCQTSE